jgi:hypothetical protein
MEKANSCKNNNFSNSTKFESMKNIFHNPSKQIKSNTLLNCFTNKNILSIFQKQKKSKYTLILDQKKNHLNNITKMPKNISLLSYNKILNENDKQLKILSDSKRNNHSRNYQKNDSDYSSNNYNDNDNSKVGLNASLSYKDFSNNSNSSYVEKNIINLKNNYKKMTLMNKIETKSNNDNIINRKNYSNDKAQVIKNINNNNKIFKFTYNNIKNNNNNTFTLYDEIISYKKINNYDIMKKKSNKDNETKYKSVEYMLEKEQKDESIFSLNNISSTYDFSKHIITNKNKLFNFDQQKSSSSKNIYSTNKKFSKSPMYSVSGRTTDKTIRTTDKYRNNIFNIKKNNKNNITNQSIIQNGNKKINNNENICNHKKKSKSVDIGFEYREYIEGSEYKKKMNPGAGVYNREMLLKKKTERKINEMRKQKMEEEMSEIQKKPKINENSKKLSKNNLPIYKRLKEIEIKKKINEQKIKEFIISENEITQTNINDKCQKTTFDELSFRNWYLLNENWNRRKNLKIEKLKNIINQENLEDESFTFKPAINKNSEKIFYKNYIYNKYPVIERLYKANEAKRAKIKKIQEEELLSFRPDINKKYTIGENYDEFMKDNQAEFFYELSYYNK